MISKSGNIGGLEVNNGEHELHDTGGEALEIDVSPIEGSSGPEVAIFIIIVEFVASSVSEEGVEIATSGGPVGDTTVEEGSCGLTGQVTSGSGEEFPVWESVVQSIQELHCLAVVHLTSAADKDGLKRAESISDVEDSTSGVEQDLNIGWGDWASSVAGSGCKGRVVLEGKAESSVNVSQGVTNVLIPLLIGSVSS